MYEHVLVGTDGSATASRAVEAAARLAQIHGARLSIAHAFDGRAPQLILTPEVEADVGWWLSSSGGRAEAVVEAAAGTARRVTRGSLEVEGVIRPGSPVAVIAAVAGERRVDAVVVGNADVHRLRLHRSIGHALSRRVRGDVVVVDTAQLSAGRSSRR